MIVIKGMDMPKNCKECPFGEFEDAVWYACGAQCLSFKNPRGEYKPDSCPLVELHEKHGRLIDADLVIEKANHEAKAMDEPLKSNFDVLVEWIVDKTPTVIEEEGSADETE